MAKLSVLLVGCGKMGGAMLNGWLSTGLLETAMVVDPAMPGQAPVEAPTLSVVSGPERLPAGFAPDIIVFAVKPQLMDATAPAYAPLVAEGAAVMSIAAGKSLRTFETYFGDRAEIVRAMPNLPASVGRGISVAVGNARLSPSARGACDQLLAAAGAVEWIEDEALLDAVTAVSGSGPAYVFVLIEALAAAGIAAGLPPDLAARLARATVIGSGELARRSSESAVELRRNVTSPNGTTAAALDILMAEDGMQRLFDRAVAAAAKRSRELAA
jgi:pyrroline-5-carboxylate reductase